MLPLYLQFALNENDKALRASSKNKIMNDYWFLERMRIYGQYFMPTLSDEDYSQLTIY